MSGDFDPQRHHRHSTRLKGYDYASPGAYFVTVVSFWRECLFGEVVNGGMRLIETNPANWSADKNPVQL